MVFAAWKTAGKAAAGTAAGSPSPFMLFRGRLSFGQASGGQLLDRTCIGSAHTGLPLLLVLGYKLCSSIWLRACREEGGAPAWRGELGSWGRDCRRPIKAQDGGQPYRCGGSAREPLVHF